VPSTATALRIALLAIALWPVIARAQAPPPDPSRQERSDARIESADTRQWALTIPRVLLLPIRLLVKGLACLTEPVTGFIEGHDVPVRVRESTTTADGLRGIRPELSWNLSFAVAPGLSYFDDRSLGRGTSLRLRFLSGGADIIEASASARPTPESWRTQVRLGVEYVRRDDEFFNGIGTSHEGSRYAIDSVQGAASAQIRLRSTLLLVVTGTRAIKRFGNGNSCAGDPGIAEVYCVRVLGHCIPGTVDPSLVPGFAEGTQFGRASVMLTLDTRDRPSAPAAGLLGRLVADYTHGIGSDDSSYFRFTGELGLAVSVWRRSHTFILRGITSLIEPTNRVPVPFSELLVLGGPDTLRGVRRGAFRDSSLLLFSAEYRWPIWMFADAALFVDYGGTFAQNFRDLDANRLRWDVGTALRITTRSQFFLRLGLAYGFSGGGLQLIISGAGG